MAVDMVAETDIVEWERLGLKAWPAPDCLVFGGWVFRTGGGYTKRANSANALGPKPPTPVENPSRDFREVMAAAERFYAANNQPSIFRLTPLADAEADGLLAAAGYEFLEPSLVMTASLKSISATERCSVDLDTESTWLEGFADLQGLTPGPRAIHDQIVQSIASPKAFGIARLEKNAVGFGLAVAEREAVGVFDIVVRPECRGRGLGRELTRVLMAWGKAQGAKTAYLQVIAANHAAVSLYESLGFRAAYEYHYRRRAL